MRPRKLAFLVGLCLFLTAGRVVADGEPQPLPSPHVRLTSGPGTLTVPGGTYLLPLGTHILDEDTFLTVEKEMKRLQESETRLKAEKKELSKGVGWGTVLVVALGAAALGFTVNHFAQ